MKRILCLLVALSLLSAMLAGCMQETPRGTESAEATDETTQPTYTEPEETGPRLADMDPPQTPEDFLFQLNLYMKENDVPLEFSFGERREDAETNWVLCTPVYTGEGTPVTTDKVELWLQYTGGESGAINTVQVFIDSPWGEASHNYHRMLSIAASAICDDAMTEESAAKLYDYESQITHFEFNEDGIAFANVYERNPDEENSYWDCTYQYSQPDALLHCYKQLQLGGYGYDREWYEVVFLEYAEQPKRLTVQELEDCINAHFASQGIPIECAFALSNYRMYDSEACVSGFDYSSTDGLTFFYGDSGYATWTARFRFTSWDDPKIQYAVPNLGENTVGYCDDPEYYEQCLYEAFAFSVSVTAKGVDTDAGIYRIDIDRPLMEFMVEPWDESWRAIYQDLVRAVCDLWTQEMGSTVLRDAADELFASGDRIDILTEDYEVWGWVSSDGRDSFRMNYFPARWWQMKEAAPILDPQRLDYKFTFNEPVVQDGLFLDEDYHVDRHRFRTDIYGESDFSHEAPSILNEYLSFAGSMVDLISEGSFDGIEYWRFYTLQDTVLEEEAEGNGNYSRNEYSYRKRFDPNFFGLDEIELEPFDFDAQLHTYMYRLYYSETEPCPMDIDYLIAAAIGLSQITDEEMTVEEAFDLHLTEQDVALTAGDWQISYTAPREVAHIICKNPATGMTMYYVIPLELFQTEFGTLEAFAAYEYFG